VDQGRRAYSVRRMRWRWGIAVLGALVALGVVSTAGVAASRVSSGGSALQLNVRILGARSRSHPWLSERFIRRFAFRAAAGYGDAHPSLIQQAEGTRYAANVVASGDLVYDWSWAYLIAMRGHFKVIPAYARDGSNGPPDPYIHGSVLTIVVNPRTGQGEDGGISNHYPYLAKLGHVTTDYRR
jgi:hypothetical protein